MVLAPRSDIDKLEEARLRLHEITAGGSVPSYIIHDVTGIMYELTHRRYKTVEV